jgi:hypothetical protein
MACVRMKWRFLSVMRFLSCLTLAASSPLLDAQTAPPLEQLPAQHSGFPSVSRGRLNSRHLLQAPVGYKINSTTGAGCLSAVPTGNGTYAYVPPPPVVMFGVTMDRPGPPLQLVNCALASPISLPVPGSMTLMHFTETWLGPTAGQSYCLDPFQASGADGTIIEVGQQCWRQHSALWCTDQPQLAGISRDELLGPLRLLCLAGTVLMPNQGCCCCLVDTTM